MSQSGQGEPEEAPREHDALTDIVNAAIATHLFEHMSRVGSLEEQVDRLQERLVALEKAPKASPRGSPEHGTGGSQVVPALDLPENSPRERRLSNHTQSLDTWRMMQEGSARVEELRKLEDQVKKLSDAAAEHEELPTKDFLVHKFNDIEGDLTMMREENGMVRDHFVWLEEQVEKWRLSWAIFALDATNMKESDRRDCKDRLKEEEARLAEGTFASRISRGVSPDASQTPRRPSVTVSRADTGGFSATLTASSYATRPSVRGRTIDNFVPAPITGSRVSFANSPR